MPPFEKHAPHAIICPLCLPGGYLEFQAITLATRWALGISCAGRSSSCREHGDLVVFMSRHDVITG